MALLSRLGLTDEEKESYSKQLSSILNYVTQLQEVRTEDVEPTAQITGLKNIFRPDRMAEADELTKKRILENAPEKEDDLFKTKTVFQ